MKSFSGLSTLIEEVEGLGLKAKSNLQQVKYCKFNYFQIRLHVNYAAQVTVGTRTLSVCKIDEKSCFCLGFYAYNLTTLVTQIELFFPREGTL